MYDYIVTEARNFYLNYINKCPADLTQLCKDFGWDILMDDLRGEDGYTIMTPGGKVTICCDNSFSSMATNRYRFTIAHEIGHIVLGHVKMNVFRLSKANRIKIDKQADLFASEILMPYSELAFLEDISTRELAKKFEVSYQAMDVRLSWLGYKTKNDTFDTAASNELAF